ncbi:MAG: carboxypeptidase-like regulatory domain-containing protein [Pirellulaceae bacterium]|nr:carboxypeptidase-like regulatory domain-containing protein [Pirellulaceae bacterium]
MRQRRRRALVEKLENRDLLTALPFGAYPDDSGEYMLGDVRVTVVLMESDPTLPFADNLPTGAGGIGAPEQNWSASQISTIKSNIQTGMQWWKDTLDAMPTVRDGLLNFTFDWTYADTPVKTAKEPIARPSYDFANWIYDFLAPAGFAQSGNFSTDIHAFNNFQRQQSNADWAFTIFVVNNVNDADLQFAPGGFTRAFSYPGGQFMVVPADRPASTYAHEAGHQFWALDEYAGASTHTAHRGYYDTYNTNASNNPGNPPDNPFVQQPSIMANGSLLDQAYAAKTSSQSSLEMIGWRDSDGDGIFDVLDVPFTLTGTGRYDTAAGMYRFKGQSRVATLPNQNTLGLKNDITINRIRQVEYSVNGGSWTVYQTLPDRTYSASLDINIPLAPGNHTIKIRTVDTRTGVMSPEFVGTTTVPKSAPQTGTTGFVFRDDNSNGVFDATEPGLADWAVNLVDQFGSPLNLQKKVEPNDFLEGTNLNTAVAGVTLSAIGNGVGNANITAVSSTLFGTAGKVFANTKTSLATDELWRWADNPATGSPLDHRGLKAQFATPVTTVSIRALSSGATGPSFGQLEAYDASGKLVAQYTTAGLTAGKSEVMTVTRAAGDIAYVIAHAHMSDSTDPKSGVLLDSLTWGPTVGTTTNVLGAWSLAGLPTGTYNVQVTAPAGYSITSPPGGIATINYVAGQSISDLSFGIRTGGPLWQNAALAANVTGDLQNIVNPQDLLAIINWMASHPGSATLPTIGDPTGGYVDPDGNYLCNAQDLLTVINYMASNPGGLGEGERSIPIGGSGGSGSANGEAFAAWNTPTESDAAQPATPTPTTAAEYFAQNPLHFSQIPGTTMPCCCAGCLAVEAVVPSVAASAPSGLSVASTVVTSGLASLIATSQSTHDHEHESTVNIASTSVPPTTAATQPKTVNLAKANSTATKTATTKKATRVEATPREATRTVRASKAWRRGGKA